MSTPTEKSPGAPLKPWGGRLDNHDLLPATERKWRGYNIFTMWMSGMHALGNYALAGSLFFLGLNGWQIIIAWLIGWTLAMFVKNWSSKIGQALAVPFPVIARMSFGMIGANVAAIIRGIIGIAWYGIQTYLASAALVVFLVAIFPGLAGMAAAGSGFLGLSALGWIAFAALLVLQAVIVVRGLDAIRWFQHLCGPGIWLVMFVLAIMLMVQADWKVDFTATVEHIELGRWQSVGVMAAAVGAVLSVNGPMQVSMPDFARYAPTNRDVRVGNFWGFPINGSAFALVVVVYSVASMSLYGEIVIDPAELLMHIDNKVVLIIGAITFVIATLGVNMVANIVPAAFDLANFVPKYIDFKRGALIASALALVILPWNLYSTPIAIQYFLGAIGSLVVPILGIMLVDYFFVRKQRARIADLYSENPEGRYAYKRGWNPVAFWALGSGAVFAVILGVAPLFAGVSFLSWFVGFFISAIVYWRFTPRAVKVAELDEAETPVTEQQA